MLILTRRISETIRINDDITVTILGVKGNQVRIGVTAPKSVSVHREEIYNRIQAGLPRPDGTDKEAQDLNKAANYTGLIQLAERL